MCFRQMQSKENLLCECIDYFRARPVFDRVLKQVREKMLSLGRVGGTAVLRGWTEEERDHLEGFFQKNLHGKKQLTVSAALLDRALTESKFASLSWEEILKAYFDDPLIGKKEQRKKEESERNSFFSQYADPTGNAGQRFLADLLSEDGEGRRLLYSQYRTDRGLIGRRLEVFLHAAKNLPADVQTVQALPVFAAKVSGDPHYFDEGTAAVKLLQLFIREHYGLTRLQAYSDTEWKARLLYRAGILKDDLSNTVLIYGLQANLQDGSLHAGVDGFYRMREPFSCTLQTLYRLARVKGDKKVYAVENPAVFAELISRFPDKTFVCTNGQLRLAVLILFDMLSLDSMLYYTGDYDPEGLGIAQRLKDRYKDRLILWEYKPEYYLRAGKQEYLPEGSISAERIKKLEKLKEPELLEIAELIRKNGKAVYQETMLSWAYQVEKEA